MDPDRCTSGGKMSLMEIQAEQERERRGSNNYNNQSRRSSGNSYNGGGGSYGSGFQSRSSSGGGRRGSQSRRASDRSSLPLERGCICSLKEKFGFIHCADRPTEIFFHYSEVSNVHPDHLQLDDEVEFRVGKSRDNPDKLAALEVNQLQPGTIEWEYEESPGERFQGLVDRPLMRSSNNGMMRRNSDNDGGSVEGLIRLLVPASETNNPESPAEGDNKNGTDENSSGKMDGVGPDKMAASEGPKIRFTTNDYNPEETAGENSGDDSRALSRKNSSSSTGGGRLSRGDLVEFDLVIEKRTRQKFARNIVLLQSERERARLAKEEQLLANATLERGVVVSLKQDFGFMRSNSRRDEVYFHYSHVQLPESNDEGGDGDDDHELKIGQEMEFLVVTEDVEDRNSNNGGKKQKTSARKVKFLPKGTVEFARSIATGVTGRVSIVPRADAGGRNAQKEHDPQSLGSIKLTESITTEDPNKNEPGSEPVSINNVLLHVGDAPGGLFSFSRGASMGLWIREGDTLLFDVTYDFVDNAYYATPTKHLVPVGNAFAASSPKVADGKENSVDKGKEEQVEATAAESEPGVGPSGKGNKNKQQKQKNSPGGPAVRLIGLASAGRAEGTVHTMKEAYGFIHFAERPVDVHFKQFELLPDAVQEDLRRNMGLTMTLNTKGDMMGFHKLGVGTEVQFDLSVQGTVMTQNQHQHRGGNKRGAQSNQQERENLKAQRILILPKGTVVQNKIMGLGVKGVVTKEDHNQPYAGILDLDEEFQQLTWAERHPYVAKMVDEILNDEHFESLVYHDIQSPKEEEVVAALLEIKAKGMFEITHIPHAGDSRYSGRLCIRKVPKEKLEEGAASVEQTGLSSPEGKVEKPEVEDETAPEDTVDQSLQKGGAQGRPRAASTRRRNHYSKSSNQSKRFGTTNRV